MLQWRTALVKAEDSSTAMALIIDPPKNPGSRPRFQTDRFRDIQVMAAEKNAFAVEFNNDADSIISGLLLRRRR